MIQWNFAAQKNKQRDNVTFEAEIFSDERKQRTKYKNRMTKFIY